MNEWKINPEDCAHENSTQFHCPDCGAGFVYCHACSEAAEAPVHHMPPVCKLPSSPAGEMGTCADISGPHPKGSHPDCDMWSGGAAPEASAAEKLVDEIMESVGIRPPSVEEVLQEFADGGSYGKDSHFIRAFSKTTLRYIASLKSAAPIAPAAQELVQELVKPVLPAPLTEAEINRLFIREERRVIFGEYTAADFRHAISGHGPLAGEWADKPHRLVYDLLRVIDTYHARAERKEGEAKQ